jgi:hypothetical protein
MDTEIKFRGTKGEWKYNVSKKNEIQVLLPNKQMLKLGFIYSDDCGNPTCCQVEAHANAKLISASPKLLEALIEISEGKGRYNDDKLIHASNTIEDMIKLAKEAIKEAVFIY